MNHLNKIQTDIEKFGSENNQEMAFLFQSLKHSLKTALKQAQKFNFDRCKPSIKHSINLSRLLHRNLSSAPAPSIIGHLDDPFAYIDETLRGSLTLALAEDFEELILLVGEIEKSVGNLLKPVKSIRPYSNDYIEVRATNPFKKTHHHQHME